MLEKYNIQDYIAAFFGVSAAIVIFVIYYCQKRNRESQVAKIANKKIKKSDNERLIGMFTRTHFPHRHALSHKKTNSDLYGMSTREAMEKVDKLISSLLTDRSNETITFIIGKTTKSSFNSKSVLLTRLLEHIHEKYEYSIDAWAPENSDNVIKVKRKGLAH
jgi:hypothetical protein